MLLTLNQLSNPCLGKFKLNLPGLVGLKFNFILKVMTHRASIKTIKIIKIIKIIVLGVILQFVSDSVYAYTKHQSSISFQSISQQEARWVGHKIYQNECAAKPKNLTYWGKVEDFPSFGIGHFIWYPQGVKQTYEETFPKMVDYVSRFKPLPLFLQKLSPFNAPWQSKLEFDQAWSGTELTQLRTWLLNTQSYQAEFIAHRFNSEFTKRLALFSQTKQAHYVSIVERMMGFKKGRFALLDYVNFKGFGNQKENYQGEQWGLFSVLEAMPLISVNDSDNVGINSHAKTHANKVLLNQFIVAAKSRLSLRVKLAPVNRKEQRWLKGWFKRLDGYLVD
ncbi:hypothetical protein [Thiomicrorhabdus sp. Milos-T2]|uniref:hypothetical protein n=1 Tax=Thiomicrorhabdus sp. Milos-T2 TaxID=90814 RepID=UPI000494525B|nr:hypothetical protein [Thiomicrorhabdus sp. Milos-T2]